MNNFKPIGLLLQAQEALEQQTNAAKLHITRLDESNLQLQSQNSQLKSSLDEFETQRRDQSNQLKDLVEMQKVVQRATQESESSRSVIKQIKSEHSKEMVIQSIYFLI